MRIAATCFLSRVSLFILPFLLLSPAAHATVSFVSATGGATLANTIEEGSAQVFVFGGIADGESTVLNFTTDGACPGVAMTGGAEFGAVWSCADGAISATVINRGGMSFGPATDQNAGTFYVTFSNPPAPPGSDTAPAALSGIQIALYGDVSSWDLSGEATESGAQFGVELQGDQGGEAHFRMYLPSAAVEYLGGVLGIYVGGKPDPFASVTSNQDGSVDIMVDIASLSAGSSQSAGVFAASEVTKKITAGARALTVGFNKTSVKSGKSVGVAVCAGTEFTAGDKVAIAFSVAGKAAGIKKSLKLGSAGCAQSTVKLRGVKVGTLTAKVSYKGGKAKGSVKVTK